MFAQVSEVVADPSVFVCVLIDEVESLTASRGASVGNEPSDAIRVVNALLTQLDKLRAHPNVLVLCTSNLTEAIDSAFLDRADLSLYVGPPDAAARYEILRSCIMELLRCEIIAPWCSLLRHKQVQQVVDVDVPDGEHTAASLSVRLFKLATRMDGVSGRRLRKLPFVAHSRTPAEQMPLADFLLALEAAYDESVAHQ